MSCRSSRDGTDAKVLDNRATESRASAAAQCNSSAQVQHPILAATERTPIVAFGAETQALMEQGRCGGPTPTFTTGKGMTQLEVPTGDLLRRKTGGLPAARILTLYTAGAIIEILERGV